MRAAWPSPARASPARSPPRSVLRRPPLPRRPPSRAAGGAEPVCGAALFNGRCGGGATRDASAGGIRGPHPAHSHTVSLAGRGGCWEQPCAPPAPLPVLLSLTWPLLPLLLRCAALCRTTTFLTYSGRRSQDLRDFTRRSLDRLAAVAGLAFASGPFVCPPRPARIHPQAWPPACLHPLRPSVRGARSETKEAGASRCDNTMLLPPCRLTLTQSAAPHCIPLLQRPAHPRQMKSFWMR